MKDAPQFDFSVEHTSYPLCFGREPLVSLLDQLLFDEAHHLVVLSGAAGRGKSALVSAYLSHLLTQSTAKPRGGGLARFFGLKRSQPKPSNHYVAYHFLSRRLPGTTQPDAVIGSLLAQLEALLPAPAPPVVDASPVQRLHARLEEVSQKVLVPGAERLLLILDGLDVAEGAERDNPLLHILPETLPAGVSALCTTRSSDPCLPWLLQQKPMHLDLDAPRFASQNAAAVHASWRHHGSTLSPRLSSSLIQELSMRAEGNLLHATMAQALFSMLPAEHRTLDAVPSGLFPLCQRLLNSLFSHPRSADILRGFKLLTAAQAPLKATWLARLLGGDAPISALLKSARPLLFPPLSTVPPDRLVLHDEVRACLVELFDWAGPRKLALPQDAADCHLQLAAELCPWPLPMELLGDARAYSYALRFGLLHRVFGGDEAGALSLCRNTAYLTEKICAVGAAALLSELLAASRAARDAQLRSLLFDLRRALLKERVWLNKEPSALPTLLYNRLICFGWSRERIEKELVWPTGLPRLRLRFALQQDGSACKRTIACREEGGESAVFGLHSMALSEDEECVIIGGGDGRVELWLLFPGAERALWSHRGHDGAVQAVLFLPWTQGKELISAGADGLLKRWNRQTGEMLGSWRSPSGGVSALALLGEDTLLVGGSDGTVCIYAGQHPRLLEVLPKVGGAVLSVVALPDGRVATGCEDGSLHIWERARGVPVKTYKGHTRGVSGLLALSDGRRLISASLDGTLKLWRLEEDAAEATIFTHGDGVSACALLQKKGVERLVAASLDGTLRLFDLASGKLCGALAGHAGWVTACAVRKARSASIYERDEAQEVLSLSLDGTLKVFSVAQAERLHARCGHKGIVTSLAFSKDEERLVSASRDFTLKVWDSQSGWHLHTLSGHTASVEGCVVLPDGKRIVSASHDGTLKIWDLASGQMLSTLRSHATWVSGCAVLPDGQHVVSTAVDGTLRVLDTRTGQTLRTLSGHTGSITGCAVLPDGKRLVSAGADGTLCVWQLESGEKLATLSGHGAAVECCVVDPDGQHVISAAADGTLKRWELASGKPLQTFSGHRAWVSACVLLPDGKRVLSAAGDDTLKVWDLETGALCIELRGHRAAIYHCVVLASAKHVVSVAGDGTLKVFDLSSGACLATAYDSAGAGFFTVAASGNAIFAGDMLGNVWMLDFDLC